MDHTELVKSLVTKAADLLHVSAGTIDPNAKLWSYFPKNKGRIEAPEVTAFCLFVAEKFNVYLTEREWENPSIIHVADSILQKQKDPEPMIRTIRKEYRDRKGGAVWALAFVIGLSGIPYYLDPRRGLKTPLLMLLGLCIIVGGIYYQEQKKWFQEVRPVLKHYDVTL